MISDISAKVWRYKKPSIGNGAHTYDDGVGMIVRILDDSGQEGVAWIGGTAAQRPLELFRHYVEYYAKLLRGLNPFCPGDCKKIRFLMEADLKTFGPGGAHSQVSATIHNALWDMRAKTAKMTLHHLFSVRTGMHRSRVRGYIAGGYYPKGLSRDETIAVLQGELRHNVENLHARAVKIKIGNPEAGLNFDIDRVKAAREAIGPEVELMVDANCAFSRTENPLETAMQYAEAFARYRVYWLEEPFDSRNVRTYREFAARSPIPIAAGENIYSADDFATFLEAGCAKYINVDAAIIGGGFSEFLTVCGLARRHGAIIVPHGCQELQIHPLLAAIDNPDEGWLEIYPTAVDPKRDQIFHGTFAIAPDGYVYAPTEIGIGIYPDEKFLQPYFLK